MKYRKEFSTIVISDVHMGSEYSKIHEVTGFLKKVNCKRLILNGDIIDGWKLHRTSKYWSKDQTNFIKVLMKMMEKQNTKIVYVRGNHDDFLEKLIPFKFSNIIVVKDYLLKAYGKSYYVTHGDIFDSVTTNNRWISKLGDIGYDILLWTNKIYNSRRVRKGLPYFSLSQAIKGKVKSAVSYISNFENCIIDIAKSKKVDGVICGHIHRAENKMIGDVHYLNSGDWVESMTALTLDNSGDWKLYNYSDFIEEYENEKKELNVVNKIEFSKLAI